MPKELKAELKKTVGQARAILEDLQRLGLSEVYATATQKESEAAIQAGLPREAAESLTRIVDDLGECRRCALAEHRSKIVFGSGNPDADIVFIGEAPGRDEDRTGEPFVGEAGRLLDRILMAMGLQRTDVYICNVVKCRPPDNRDPQGDEISACEPFLLRQLDTIRPRVIVTLGNFATRTLTRSDTAMSRLRGEWQSYRNTPLMPTYHPAYLLRSPVSKREVWEDMKAVLKKLRAEESSD